MARWREPPVSTSRPVPRVPGRPLVGNLLEFWRSPVGFLVDAYQNHGPVFRFDVANGHSVVIAGEVARDVLAAQGKGASRCPMTRLGLFKPFASEVGLPVFDAEGDAHTQLRELIRLPYSRQITSQFVPEMDQLVAETVGTWLPGQSIDLFDASCRFAQHAMMEVLTPVRLRGHSDAVSKAGNRVMYTQFRLLPESSLGTKDYLRARDEMQGCINEAIDRHAGGEFRHEARVHLIDACLDARSSAGHTMSKDVVRGVCFYALAGSEIYMGRLVGFLVYELLRNRAFLDSVLAEIDSTAITDDLPSAFRRMAHLRAAYQETLRCYPLIPGYSYVSTEPMNVGGYAIDAGEQLMFAPYLGHYDAENYANPNIFDPERHNQTRREFARSGLFVPFGVGAHACAAPGMVETVVLAVATAILRRVDLRLQSPSQKMDLRLAPLIAPAKPVVLRVVGRRAPLPRAAAQSRLVEKPDFHLSQATPDWVGDLPDKAVEDVPAGRVLIEQGTVADAFFVLLEGRVSVHRKGPDGQATLLAAKDPGSSFGEVGLLKKVPRTATVIADSPSKVYRFEAAEFATLIGEHDLTADDLRSLYYARYIQGLLKSSLAGLSTAMEPESMTWKLLAAGEYIFRQGAPSDAFYIVVKGTAEVLAEWAGTTKCVATLGPGSFFGEIGLMNSQPRSATVRATTDLKTLMVTREVFLETLQDHPEALADLALITCQRLLAKVQAAPR